MLFKYINICWAPRERLKPLPFRLGFQHLPWGSADVNARKIMFDPYIDQFCVNFLLKYLIINNQGNDLRYFNYLIFAFLKITI